MARKMPVTFPDKIKEGLEKMSEETGQPQSSLVVMATTSMLENYKKQGSFIFVDLMSTTYRNNLMSEKKEAK